MLPLDLIQLSIIQHFLKHITVISIGDSVGPGSTCGVCFSYTNGKKSYDSMIQTLMILMFDCSS